MSIEKSTANSDTADALIERVARAMCGADGFDADEITPGSAAPRWYSYAGEARRFLAARSALDSAVQRWR